MGNKTIIQPLKEKHKKLTSKPYQSVLVSVKARVDTSKDNLDGFAEAYDGLIFIKSIKSITKGTCKKK